MLLLLLFCFICYVEWFPRYQLLRYIFFVLPFIAIIAGYAIENLYSLGLSAKAHAGRILRYLVVSAMVISLSFTLFLALIYNIQFFPVVFGQVSKDEFLSSKAPYYEDISYANRQLPKDSKLLVYGLYSYYYFEHDYIPGPSVYQNIVDYSKMQSAEELLRRLSELKITHIFREGGLFSDSEVDVFNSEAISFYAELEKKGYIVPIYQNTSDYIDSRTLSIKHPEKIVIYEIRYPPNLKGER